MRIPLALISVFIVIGLAAPAYGEPEGDDDSFLRALHNAGITYTGPDEVITSAKAVCGMLSKGETGLQVINDIRIQNPGMTLDGAAQFAAIASNSYCPQHLTPKAR